MRILVTGGTGFLGRHLLPMLGKHEVFCLLRGRHRVRPYPANVAFIDADLGRGLDTGALPDRMDAIVHLAQSDRFRDFPAGAADVFRVNVEAPAKLLEWAVGAGVGHAVFASTGTVYEPFAGRLAEEDAVAPTGFYGASKLAAEALSAPYRARFPVAQLRVFFLYGPGQEAMMMARLLAAVEKGEPLTLPKSDDGLVFVPTYVEDCARVFAKAVEEGWSGVTNVASPHVVSLAEVLETIGRVTGKALNVTRVDAPPSQRIVPTLDRLRALVDVDAFLAVEEGLRRTWDARPEAATAQA